jgi:hypothetical protein
VLSRYCIVLFLAVRPSRGQCLRHALGDPLLLYFVARVSPIEEGGTTAAVVEQGQDGTMSITVKASSGTYRTCPRYDDQTVTPVLGARSRSPYFSASTVSLAFPSSSYVRVSLQASGIILIQIYIALQSCIKVHNAQVSPPVLAGH